MQLYLNINFRNRNSLAICEYLNILLEEQFCHIQEEALTFDSSNKNKLRILWL